RTEKLSLVTPMVLRNSGRVGSRRFLEKPLDSTTNQGAFCVWYFAKKVLYLRPTIILLNV
uniref:hypothetical protein n=1 Tax=Bacteroides finegoldii TaxID=338188 RepID=UPI0035696153